MCSFGRRFLTLCEKAPKAVTSQHSRPRSGGRSEHVHHPNGPDNFLMSPVGPAGDSACGRQHSRPAPVRTALPVGAPAEACSPRPGSPALQGQLGRLPLACLWSPQMSGSRSPFFWPIVWCSLPISKYQACVAVFRFFSFKYY